MEKAEEILRRADSAFTEAARDEARIKSAFAFAAPNRLGLSSGGDENDVFDSTACTGVTRGANRLLNEVAPPFERNVFLEAGPMVTDESRRHDMNKKLAEVTDLVEAVLASGEFYTATPEVFIDLMSGQGCLLVMEGDERTPCHFTAIPRWQVALENGVAGRVEGVYRKHEIEARLIEATWADAKLPQDLSEMANDREHPDKKIELVECVQLERNGLKSDWAYRVIWRGKKEILVERRYLTNPFITPRWSCVPGEANGRGPLLSALPDILTANKTVELILQNAALAVSGVFTVLDDGVINPDTVRLMPGGMIPVRSNGSGPFGPSIKALETGHDFETGQLVLNDLRQSIKKALLDDQLPPDAGPVRSATEVVQRMKELAQDLGGAYGRIVHEFWIPLVQRVLDILLSRGLINERIKIDQLLVQVQVVSPMARAQSLGEVESVLRAIDVISHVAGMQGLAYTLKLENTLTWIAEKLGVPQTLVRSDADKQEIQQMIAGLVQQQQPAAMPQQQPQQQAQKGAAA